MNINNFKSLRLNDSENFVDVDSYGGHSNYGVVLTAYDFASEAIEVRRRGRETAMFVLKYEDTEIPDYWKNAEILYSTRR